MFQYEKAWQDARARIAAAARACGRDPAAIRLLAVSKAHPPEALRALHALGQRAFGENYVQEALAKMDALADLRDVEWHLIGPLQSNKTAAVAARFSWVHTVDREKVARRLSAARPPALPPLEVCVQVNISAEPGKSGVVPGDALALAQQVAALPRLRLRGFMGIAEATADRARQRAQFRVLGECAAACRAAGLAVDTLSMGMSADLEAAVAEGATLVRLGTALFGERATGVPAF
ncbi:MAG: YggS family pyridoxal phosphate-dependent enzyme [Betaproteobacteria bacterium]|mgnify:CR=1 FL=1|nr:YggS family pyridoxal phosphate-dependent enzyme [Betaproteobacteria bacterium]